MKRSEMVHLIEEYIKSYIERPDYLKYLHSEASGLLERLEKKGMLPPPTRVDHILYDIIYARYEEGQDCDENQFWEPEE